MLRGFLILVLFFIVAEALRYIFNWPVSGGVLGMMLLTVWLMRVGHVSAEIATASNYLISILIVLIMPGVVGVFFLDDQFAGQWLAIAVALVLGTFASVATTFLLMLRLMPKANKVCEAGKHE